MLHVNAQCLSGDVPDATHSRMRLLLQVCAKPHARSSKTARPRPPAEKRSGWVEAEKDLGGSTLGLIIRGVSRGELKGLEHPPGSEV